jgi:hypothetical protein
VGLAAGRGALPSSFFVFYYYCLLLQIRATQYERRDCAPLLSGKPFNCIVSLFQSAAAPHCNIVIILIELYYLCVVSSQPAGTRHGYGYGSGRGRKKLTREETRTRGAGTGFHG